MMRLISLKAVLILAIISIVGIFSTPLHAQTANPDLDIVTTGCFQNIYVDGDIYCTVVYDLPIQTSVIPSGTPEAWCAELFNQAGCSNNPVDPSEPTSLPDQSVLIRLNNIDDLLALNVAQRVGYSVGGVYLGVGHGVTYGDVNIDMCISANDDIYSPATEKCASPNWNNNASDSETQREKLGEFFKFAMLSKEDVESRQEGFYVDTEVNLINGTGAIIIEEAMPGATSVLKDVFTTSVTTVILSTPTPVANDLQNQVGVLNPNAATDISGFGEAFALAPDGAIVAISIGIAVIGFIVFVGLFKNVVWGTIGSVAALSLGAPFGIIYLPGFFVMLALLALLAGGFLVKKVVLA